MGGWAPREPCTAASSRSKASASTSAVSLCGISGSASCSQGNTHRGGWRMGACAVLAAACVMAFLCHLLLHLTGPPFTYQWPRPTEREVAPGATPLDPALPGWRDVAALRRHAHMVLRCAGAVIPFASRGPSGLPRVHPRSSRALKPTAAPSWRALAPDHCMTINPGTLPLRRTQQNMQIQLNKRTLSAQAQVHPCRLAAPHFPGCMGAHPFSSAGCTTLLPACATSIPSLAWSHDQCSSPAAITADHACRPRQALQSRASRAHGAPGGA